MRLSARADYALRAAIELAAAPDVRVTAEQLAVAQGLPAKFLETILTICGAATSCAASAGRTAGSGWPGPPPEISLAEIIRAIDGQLLGTGRAAGERVLPGGGEPLQRVWIALRANERAVLEKVTLADIVSGNLP